MKTSGQSTWERCLATAGLAPITTALIFEFLSDPCLATQVHELAPQSVADLHAHALRDASVPCDDHTSAPPSLHALCRTALEHGGLVRFSSGLLTRGLRPPFVSQYAARRHRILQLRRAARRTERQSQIFLLRSIMSRTRCTRE